MTKFDDIVVGNHVVPAVYEAFASIAATAAHGSHTIVGMASINKLANFCGIARVKVAMKINVVLPYTESGKYYERWAVEEDSIDFGSEKEKADRCTVSFAALESSFRFSYIL